MTRVAIPAGIGHPFAAAAGRVAAVSDVAGVTACAAAAAAQAVTVNNCYTCCQLLLHLSCSLCKEDNSKAAI